MDGNAPEDKEVGEENILPGRKLAEVGGGEWREEKEATDVVVLRCGVPGDKTSFFEQRRALVLLVWQRLGKAVHALPQISGEIVHTYKKTRSTWTDSKLVQDGDLIGADLEDTNVLHRRSPLAARRPPPSPSGIYADNKCQADACKDTEGDANGKRVCGDHRGLR